LTEIKQHSEQNKQHIAVNYIEISNKHTVLHQRRSTSSWSHNM